MIEDLRKFYIKDRIQEVDEDFLSYEEEMIDPKDLKRLEALILEDFFVTNPLSNPTNSILLYITGLSNEFDFSSGRSKMKGGAAPDIDVDWDPKKRHLISQYYIDKYGREQIAQIGTYGEFHLQSIGKDLARISEPVEIKKSDYENDEVYEKALESYNKKKSKVWKDFEELDKVIPPPKYGLQPSYEDMIKKVPTLPQDHPLYNELAAYADGMRKQIGVHAAGIVISPVPITDILPIWKNDTYERITQFNKDEVEELGLIKFDELVVDSLSVIDECLRLIKNDFNIQILLEKDIYEKDGDFRAYKVLSSGLLAGIWQMETSPKARELIEDIKPETIGHLSDITSINRPGPLDCLGSNTKILYSITNFNNAKQYRYQTIKELYVGWLKRHKKHCSKVIKKLISIDETNMQFVANDIVNIQPSGIKKLFNIEVKYAVAGYKQGTRKSLYIEASINHKFLTKTGWKILKDLEIGDYICIQNKRCGVLRSKNIPGKKNFRNICFNNYEYKCIFCNWKEGSLDVNHLEGNRFTNNNAENLCFMCPNHHRMYSEGKLLKEEVILAREKYRLYFSDELMFAQISSIEFLREDETYDIEMATPYNNFIAGEFVVHNSQLDELYIKNKKTNNWIEELPPVVAEILKDTYGVMIYQEQVMKLCSKLAGFTPLESDSIRKAMGKKDRKKLDKYKETFISNSEKLGFVTKDYAIELWSQMEKFAFYAFNLSHACLYSAITYATAYLKGNYPIQFFTALMTIKSQEMAPQDWQLKVNEYKKELEFFHIELVPPDINRSLNGFYSEDNKIYFGLAGIKTIAASSAENIIEARKEGPFKSIMDFLSRVHKGKVTTGKFEALVKAGCFDRMGYLREDLLEAKETLYQYFRDLSSYKERLKEHKERESKREEIIKAKEEGTKGLKLPPALKLKEPPEIPEIPRYQKIKVSLSQLREQVDFIGCFLGPHPSLLIEGNFTDIEKLWIGEKHQVRCLVTSVKKILTKVDKKEMAFLTIEDRSSKCEAVMFSKTWLQHSQKIKPGTLARATVKVESENPIKVIIEKLEVVA